MQRVVLSLDYKICSYQILFASAGLRNANNRQQQSKRFECEFCFMSFYQIKGPKPDILILSGNFAIQMECWYVPGTNSRCPKIVRGAKESARSFAIRNGERLTQYSLTPSCDRTKDFQQRYREHFRTQRVAFK